MKLSWNKGRKSIEKNDEQQKSELSSNQNHFLSAVAIFKTKSIKLIKVNVLQSDNFMVHKMKI